MKIDLSELLREVGNTADVQESETVSYPEDSLVLVKPVEMDLQLINAGDLILLRGTVSTAAELDCSRCLSKYVLPLNIEINEEFSSEVPVSSKNKRKEKELHAEDFISPLDKDKTIDVSEIVRQNLLLELPLQPLCRHDCPGQKG